MAARNLNKRRSRNLFVRGKSQFLRTPSGGRSPGVLHIGAAAPVWSVKEGVQRGEIEIPPLVSFSLLLLFPFWKPKKGKANPRPPLRRATL